MVTDTPLRSGLSESAGVAYDLEARGSVEIASVARGVAPQPVVYVVFLPPIGWLRVIIPTFAKQPLAGYRVAGVLVLSRLALRRPPGGPTPGPPHGPRSGDEVVGLADSCVRAVVDADA